MGVRLWHIETTIRNQSFLIDFPLFAVKKGNTQKRKLYPVFDSPIHDENDGANCS